MGKARYLYNNLAEKAAIAASTTASGRVGSAMSQQTGGAVFHVQGEYSGDEDRLYTVQIDDAGPGAEVGEATFAWRRDDSSGWEAGGVATVATPTLLERGISVYWTSGDGDDFGSSDMWSFIAEQPFGVGKLIDQDPNTDWQGADGDLTAQSLVADLGSAKQVRAFVLGHHNLSATATVTLQANSSDSWGAPAYSQALTITTGHLALFLDETYQYWRVLITDAANTDGYLRAAGIYLGDYFEPSRNFDRGYDKNHLANERERDAGGNPTGRLLKGRHLAYRLPYSDLSETDKDDFEALFIHVKDASGEESISLWLCVDADTPSSLVYGNIGSDMGITTGSAPWRYQTEIDFTEQPRSKA